jgi:hypothetical protein
MVRSFGGTVGIDSDAGLTNVWFSLPAIPDASGRTKGRV